MLASTEALPPSVEVKSEHRFPASTLIEQQHLAQSSPRRSSFSLYRPNTHQSEVYSEFNWETHSNAKLSNPVNSRRNHSDNMEKKLSNSPGTVVVCQAPRGAASPSTSSSDTVNSDGINVGHDICAMSLTTSLDPPIDEKTSSNKRQRPHSPSQSDYRTFDRPSFTRPRASVTLPPDSFAATGGHLSNEKVDLVSLPTIPKREENENNVLPNDVTGPLQFTSQFPYHSPDSVGGNAAKSSSPSVQRPAHQSSHSLQLSSELDSFAVGEYAAQPQRSHTTTLRPSHPATSMSYGSQQSNSQSLTFPSHPNGYLSALPSPVVTQFDDQTLSSHRPSYPASPIMTLSAPNSATFPPAHNSSFRPLSPSQTNSTPTGRHFASPSPPPFHPRHTTQFATTPYRHNDAVEKVLPTVSPSIQESPSCTTCPPTSNSSVASLWSSVENQAPRRRGKLPTAVTGILKAWLMSHTAHPYPTEEEKKSLCERTDLSMNQVSNWFINARRRILVPPSAGNSVHEVRQPVRRQAQSQLARAASNASFAPPCLTIRDMSPQPMPSSPSTGVTMFSPVSASSPNLSSGRGFGFHYPLPHQPTHESAFHGGSLIGCRPVNSLSSSPSPWQHAHLNRQPPSSPLYPSHGSQAVSYYPSSQSPYPQYHVHNSSVSSTPLPSPLYSYAGCAPSFSHNQARLHSPRSHPISHPPTPTALHSCETHHHAPESYIPQTACNQSISHPTTPNKEK